MHSSRMRTGHGWPFPRWVYLEGNLHGLGGLPGSGGGDLPSSPREQTNTCENITFPILRMRVGKNWTEKGGAPDVPPHLGSATAALTNHIIS